MRLRIAQVAPLIESVPPQLYGGTERVVSYLTEELIELGHDVTLYASADSITQARLVPCCPEALRLDPRVKDVLPYYMVLMDRVRRDAGKFDILHFHIDQLQFPVFRDIADRTLTTLHGRQDHPDLQHLYRSFPEMPLVSISQNQRTPLPAANFVANIPHGLPLGLHQATYEPSGGYVAFLGRISPEKGVDKAIRIASAAGLRLKIAAKVDKVDEDYFRSEIAPLFAAGSIEFVGEIDELRKTAFLGEARALLFPIDWPEPFGLVMIEAMACGTPVLAFARGSVPEVIEPGSTGAIVDSVEEALAVLPRVLELDRRGVRRRFEECFSARRMATDYVSVYETLLACQNQLRRTSRSNIKVAKTTSLAG